MGTNHTPPVLCAVCGQHPRMPETEAYACLLCRACWCKANNIDPNAPPLAPTRYHTTGPRQ